VHFIRRMSNPALRPVFFRARPFLRLAATLSMLVSAAVVSRAQISLTVGDNPAEPVVIESAVVSTEVTGRLAVTTHDLVFANPNNRVLEGTFEFPLLDGQRVVRFALDINGALREAVPVEKERGRVVFEEIERRQADPGLIEQTAGNNYRARIYPIPARGTRRVVIAYQEDLAPAAGAAPRYRLALDFPGVLKKFTLAAAVFASGSGAPAKITTTLPLELPAWRENRVLEVTRENFTARGVLEIELPAAGPRPRVLTETFDGREYFYAEANVSLPPIAPKPRVTPKCVGILWDASGSGSERDHAREFALLDAWFARVPNVEVRLVCFRDRAAAPVIFKVRNGKWSGLRAALEKITYDGASSFDGLKDDGAVDEWLLFSDGLFNYGTTLGMDRLPLRAAVHAINASPRAAPAALRQLAAHGGGEFVDLMSVNAQAAAHRLRVHPLRIIAVERDPEAVAHVFPEAGAPFPDGGLLTVTGVLRKQTASVRVKIGLDGGAVLGTVEIPLKSGEGASRLAARAWALAKIERLSDNAEANREDIRKTSRQFRIVTADTSLIVLETLDDYIRHDIEPPEDLREEWLEEHRGKGNSFEKTRRKHLDAIAAAFDEKVDWWNKEFPKGAPPLVKEKKQDAQPSRPAPQPAPPPATTSAPQPEESRDLFSAQTLLDTNVHRIATDVAGSVAVASLDETVVLSSFSVGSADQRRGGKHAASISLQRWSPKAAYLDHLRRAAPGGRYAVYLEERADHARQPGFYLDAAGFFFDEAKDADTALQILSNLAELGLEDAALLRVLGHRLTQAGRPDLALPVFERVLKIRGEEPQSRRDLALVCARLGQYQRAVDLLWEVVERPWDARFDGIALVALGELNAIVATCGQPLDLGKIDPRLRKNLPAGLRVVLTWDADNCDIDLWVDDPNGERAYYGNQLTYQGGLIPEDFTAGYGPEEFLLRAPKPGRYVVRIDYYGDGRQTALGPVTAQVRLITDFGTTREKEKTITVRLGQDDADKLEIGSIEIVGE
jgi:tetratricopeptide (TPR) repeat protein